MSSKIGSKASEPLGRVDLYTGTEWAKRNEWINPLERWEDFRFIFFENHKRYNKIFLGRYSYIDPNNIRIFNSTDTDSFYETMNPWSIRGGSFPLVREPYDIEGKKYIVFEVGKTSSGRGPHGPPMVLF